MIKKFIPLVFLALAGCNTTNGDLSDIIPSFWDDNQSAAIVNVRSDIVYLDCTKSQVEQVKTLEKDLTWFILYSDSKGFMQKDVIKLVTPIHDTVQEWLDRASIHEPSKAYCKMKKEIIQDQVEIAAKAVLGRF